MAVIFLYFALFLGVHFLSKQFLDKPSGRAECKRPGAARLFQLIPFPWSPLPFEAIQAPWSSTSVSVSDLFRPAFRILRIQGHHHTK